VPTTIRLLPSVVTGGTNLWTRRCASNAERRPEAVLARAQAESETRADIGDYAQRSRDAIDAFDKQLASMRFSATAAREHAISIAP
jgi:hypothetical protein